MQDALPNYVVLTNVPRFSNSKGMSETLHWMPSKQNNAFSLGIKALKKRMSSR